MPRFIAKLNKKFLIDGVEYKKGDSLILEQSDEFAPAYWIVKDDVTTRDLLTNEFGVIFSLVEEIKLAA